MVDIIEAKAHEKKMVTVPSAEMAKAIADTGRIALYGIYFDFNKAEVKPESDPTIEQVAKLLKETPALKLLVAGHTDNVGGFSFNMDLSQRRAAAVVSALSARHGIAKDRLDAAVGVYLPVQSRRTRPETSQEPSCRAGIKLTGPLSP